MGHIVNTDIVSMKLNYHEYNRFEVYYVNKAKRLCFSSHSTPINIDIRRTTYSSTFVLFIHKLSYFAILIIHN